MWNIIKFPIVNKYPSPNPLQQGNKCKIWTRKYQYKVLSKLQKQKKIGVFSKLLWGIFIEVWHILQYTWVNLDFVTWNQTWLLNIARKVHQNQFAPIWMNISWKTKWKGRDIKFTLWGSQSVWIGINISWNTFHQDNLFWINIGKNICEQRVVIWINLWKYIYNQCNWIWIQWLSWDNYTTEGNLQYSQFTILWLQGIFWNMSETDQRWLITISYTPASKWVQYVNFWINFWKVDIKKNEQFESIRNSIKDIIQWLLKKNKKWKTK